MHSDHSAAPVPLSLLTGFLGSGKTTVLNHLLHRPELARTAVIINEFGEIGLDHELVEASTETMVLLQSGCLCCTVRGDLIATLHGLLDQRRQGRIPAFDRVVIETTGLADPAPILHTLITDAFLSETFFLDGVIVTVDAVLGTATLDVQEEAVKQAAMADRILLTKTDLTDEDTVRHLESRLRAINPAAPIIHILNGAVNPHDVLDAGLYDPESKGLDVRNWLSAEAYPEPGSGHHHHHHHHHHQHHRQHHHDVNRHDDRISAVAYTVEDPIPPVIFDLWLETMTRLCGPDLLRLKGIINVEGAPAPFVLNGVQHIFHPPVLLSGWPSNDRRSRIVLIGRDLTDQFLKESFSFLGTALRDRHDDHSHQDASA